MTMFYSLCRGPRICSYATGWTQKNHNRTNKTTPDATLLVGNDNAYHSHAMFIGPHNGPFTFTLQPSVRITKMLTRGRIREQSEKNFFPAPGGGAEK